MPVPAEPLPPEAGTPLRPAGPDAGQPTIRAAGCVLWRRTASSPDLLEFALVHRPKYDDWSLPKGKLHRGESERDAAVREVHEETGLRCVLGPALTTSRYLVNGQPKTVSYWTAEALDGAFEANDEVDRLLWLPPEEARAHLSHSRDAELLTEALVALGRP